MKNVKYILFGLTIGLFIGFVPVALANSNTNNIQTILSKVKSIYSYVLDIYDDTSKTQNDINSIESDIDTINVSLYGSLGFGGMEDDVSDIQENLTDVDQNVQSLCDLLNTTAQNAYYACYESGSSHCIGAGYISCY